MSVAFQLGLQDPDTDLLADARAQWLTWCGAHPQLAVVGDLIDLPAWIAQADKERVDEVLWALARLASPADGDDVRAAGALACLLLPGARVIAHRLRAHTPRIDEVVAAQLWLEVRAFPWQRRRKVAANVLMDTRRGVLRELGVGEHLRAVDRTWWHTVPVAPEAELWTHLDARGALEETSAREELDELLTCAVRDAVVDEHDCALLVDLAEAAVSAHTGGARANGQGGLCSVPASRAVAALRGVSETTVRRRATRSMRALTAAYARVPA